MDPNNTNPTNPVVDPTQPVVPTTDQPVVPTPDPVQPEPEVPVTIPEPEPVQEPVAPAVPADPMNGPAVQTPSSVPEEGESGMGGGVPPTPAI